MLTARRAAMRVTKRRHLHPQQFQSGTHVRAAEGGGFSRQMPGQHACHLIAWRDQTEDLTVPQCAFTNGKHLFIAGLAAIVNLNAAARSQRQARFTCQLIARPDTGGEQHQIAG